MPKKLPKKLTEKHRFKKRIGLLAIGDELLDGRVVNNNASWLSLWFVERGFEIYAHEVVPDDLDRMVVSLKRLAGECDVLVTTGGLGPTGDDMTRDAFAMWLGDPLIEDRSWTHDKATKSIQRFRPESARKISNPLGTAMGFMGAKEECRYFALPGVPSEMKAMVRETVEEELLGEDFSSSLKTSLWKTFGLRESEIQPRLKDLFGQEGLRLSVIQKTPELHVQLTQSPQATSSQEKAFQKTAFELDKRLRDVTFSKDPKESFASMIVSLLIEKKKTCVTAESCTGGWISKLLVDIPGSSKAFERGFVTYSNEAKMECLGVQKETLERYGAVSEEVAREMAEGALSHSHGDIALSVTGVAGPGGGTAAKPVGTIFAAITQKQNARSAQSQSMKPLEEGAPGQGLFTTKVFHWELTFDREKNRLCSAYLILDCLRRILLEEQ
jgi:nicotinamide-nucleotide amidase